jgi:penicillin-binding protein 1A
MPSRRPTARPLAVALVAALAASAAQAQQPASSTGEAWRIIALPQSSQVLARDGSLIGEIGRQVRTNVALRTLPRYVGQAFVAVEDQRFYRHNGVDIVGIGGAALDALRGDARGASTITQQLVGNMHPDVVDRRDRGAERKLREQRAALEMERHYNKEQILEAYINTINYGHGWYGIEAAARHYFGKPAARLTLAEAASLASLPKSPVLYDPARYASRNRERRNLVLSLMAAQGYITRAQATEAQAEPVRTVPDAGYAVPAPYYVDVVRVQAERAGVPVAQGGYRVHTTLDPALQRSATAALRDGLKAVEGRAGYRHPKYNDSSAVRGAKGTNYLQGMVVAMDPATGDVRALVGGRDYEESPYNRAVSARRQPGSAIKPVVYAAAIATGQITTASIVYDTALAIPLDNGRTYRPGNADNRFLGSMTLRDALVGSRNPVAVQLGQQLGMDTVAALARRMGISTPIYPGPSSAIGASAVQPLDLVQAYTTFANLGAAVEPRFLARIDDRAGRAVYNGRAPQFSPALDAGTAFIVRDMMRDVVERGTAASVRREVPAAVPVAGKTGTTNDNSDVWFVGMTPELVAGVWLGFDQPKTITPGAAGGTLAAPIWGEMVAQYYRGRTAGRWTPPADVVTAEIDRMTGLPADSLTPPDQRRTEYFLPGTEPGAGRFDPWAVFRYGPLGF